MDGEEVAVSREVHHLRVQLWSLHLGLKSEEEKLKIFDPVCDETFHDIVSATAKENQRHYCLAFPTIPNNRIYSLKQLDTIDAKEKIRQEANPALYYGEQREHLQEVKGHWCEWPIDFLLNESNMSNISTQVVSNEIFQ